MRIRLQSGRFLTTFDTAETKRVAVINQALAHHFWPGQNPLGKRFRLRDEKDVFREVVGVVTDCVEGAVGEPIRGMAYFPIAQEFRPRLTLHVSTSSDPRPVLRTALAKIQVLDRELALTGPSTADDLIADGLWAPRLGAGLFGLFGTLGLALASVGIYGLMAHSVARRTNEIGIRMALGATSADVMKLVVRQGLLLALIGLVSGGIAALLLTPMARSLLFGIAPREATTLLTTAVVFVCVSAVACWLPALRAARLNPISSLRHE